MTRIDVGLMRVCSNCHEHKNYEDKWQKDKFNSKSKTSNKITKTITQRLKSKHKLWKTKNKLL
jgi:hypothetical protein